MTEWTSDIDPSTIPDHVLRSEWARRNSLKRQRFGSGSGRPRITERCACGAMTKNRAIVRKHNCKI